MNIAQIIRPNELIDLEAKYAFETDGSVVTFYLARFEAVLNAKLLAVHFRSRPRRPGIEMLQSLFWVMSGSLAPDCDKSPSGVDIRRWIIAVIASEAKQSRVPPHRPSGLFRRFAPRNDGVA